MSSAAVRNDHRQSLTALVCPLGLLWATARGPAAASPPGHEGRVRFPAFMAPAVGWPFFCLQSQHACVPLQLACLLVPLDRHVWVPGTQQIPRRPPPPRLRHICTVPLAMSGDTFIGSEGWAWTSLAHAKEAFARGLEPQPPVHEEGRTAPHPVHILIFRWTRWKAHRPPRSADALPCSVAQGLVCHLGPLLTGS